MKGTRHSEEQIIAILKQGEAGVAPAEFARTLMEGMSGRLIQRGSEAGAQTPPLLRASSPLKPKNQLRTNIVIGTANGGTSGRNSISSVGKSN